jgi:hypothetical protein
MRGRTGLLYALAPLRPCGGAQRIQESRRRSNAFPSMATGLPENVVMMYRTRPCIVWRVP